MSDIVLDRDINKEKIESFMSKYKDSPNKDIINKELEEKIDNFWKSYKEMVKDKNFRSEINKCNILYSKLDNLKVSNEEEEYVISMINLCENVVDSIKCDSGYWGN